MQVNTTRVPEERFPLHYAAEKQASVEVVQALLAAHPEAAKEKDGYGQLPLHSAVAYQASVEVVQRLLSAHPGAAKEKDGRGSLPLHCSTTRRCVPPHQSASAAAYETPPTREPPFMHRLSVC